MATLLPSPDISSFPAGRIHSGNVKKLVLRRRVVRVCSSLKDLEDVGLLYGQFSAPSKVNTMSSATKLDKEEEQKRNYYLNTGSAIRILREEFPALFYKEPNFDIYRLEFYFEELPILFEFYLQVDWTAATI